MLEMKEADMGGGEGFSPCVLLKPTIHERDEKKQIYCYNCK